MRRKVYLQGELGERFGSSFTVNSDTYQDIFKCINANRPTFKPFLHKCHQEDICMNIVHQGKEIPQEELLTPLEEGDVTISLVPAGSKKAIKIVVALVIVFVALPAIGAAAAGSAAAAGMTTGQLIGAAMSTKLGLGLAMVATNLAIMGIMEMMMPDPSVDNDNPSNYLYGGSDSGNVTEGDPIPILYGELRVPGKVVAVDMIEGDFRNPSHITTAQGFIKPVDETITPTVDLTGYSGTAFAQMSFSGGIGGGTFA